MKRKLQLEQQLYLDYARSAVRILARSVELARGVEPDFYRVIALELRLLLCDTTRQHERVVDSSLAARLWPDLLWPALDSDGRFSESLPGLPLAAWLEQPLPSTGTTLRQLIRRVCDQDGGAHVDLRPQATRLDYPSTRAAILQVAEVVLGRLSGA